MERYNPFSNASITDDSDPFSRSTESPNSVVAANNSGVGSNQQSPRRYPQQSSPAGASRFASGAGISQASPPQTSSATNLAESSSRYSTAFPDPFSDTESTNGANSGATSARSSNINPNQSMSSTTTTTTNPNANPRSNSVTFAPSSSRSVDDQATFSSPSRSSRREAGGGISSFLSRATSVTSSTVTDRMNEAVGSMRNAVDTISNQIQQAVPSNLNERLSSTASNLTNANSTTNTTNNNNNTATTPNIEQQQQQSAASYLAAKLSSATNQFTSSSPSSSSLPLISRQRVILILDTPGGVDWQQQFINYRRLASGLGPSSSNALTSFFSSATAQLTSASSSNQLDGVDLIEQADFRDVSILANQSTSTATVLVTSTGANRSEARFSAVGAKTSTKIIRPEYVVIRQRTKNGLEHMRGIVTALNYCLVPIFEPMEIWDTFQDRRLIFAKLLRVQKQLGKENFPLIPQVYCQTHQDFLNYVNSSSVVLPCLVRTGLSGKGKIKMDNIQMLKDFASIVATSNMSCTVEPYLDVKCDLVVQKLGPNNLKLFRKGVVQGTECNSLGDDATRQSASRQTSLGTGVLSSLISTTTNQAQQVSRQSSNLSCTNYEKLAEVATRYKNWIEALAREFHGKLEVFCMKIAVTNQDREYIVGLGDCTMEFLGSVESQEEDRNNFVELIVNNMNAILPKSGNNLNNKEPLSSASRPTIDRRSSDDRAPLATTSLGYQSTSSKQESPLADKKRFTSQIHINGHNAGNRQSGSIGGQMGNRSQSVSMNQSEYMMEKDLTGKSVVGMPTRRGSDRSDSFTNETSIDGGSSSLIGQSTIDSSSSGLHQRQASLGQSFFDQTSTAFNTLQKQSMSFFKRLDSRVGDGLGGSTPPQSAKSDRGYERSNNSNDDLTDTRKNGFKSQSIDSWVSVSGNKPPNKRETPPKPPPPQSIGNRQSSLASYSTYTRPNTSTTPASTRQNSTVGGETASTSGEGVQRARVVRQNSALSAFEPYDPDITLHQKTEASVRGHNASTGSSSMPMSRASSQQVCDANSRTVNKQLDPVKRSSNFDSASITSGDSNSTSETTTAEDTMNNLKKTFASIFGDKCE